MKTKNIIIIFSVFLLCSCGYDVYEMPEDVYIELNDNNFIIFEEHKSDELIKETNAEILSQSIILENKDVGEYTYTLDYKYKKRKYKYDITYTIIDNIEPIFISASSNITIKVNDEVNLCEKIVYGDNYDNNPVCNIIGNYDLNKIGTYNDLEFVINDKSNNIAKKKFNLNVVNEIKKTNSNTNYKYLYIDDIIRKYKNDNTSIGIDVSRWQGNVDFEKVKAAGIEFVIMRIGVQTNPGEEISLDSRFKEYYRKVKELGFKVSVYVYNTSTSYEDGVKTANWVIKELNGDKLDLPIAYDWENWTNFTNYHISLHTLSEGYRGFEDTIKKAGYDSMLYSSKYYLENVWMNYENSNVWLAHYTSNTDYKGKYMMWQMTSSCKINGITENTVDIDILYK